ncbi:MAG: NAD(P)/FAD-dependent oxidoreductase [Candidatus Omnitrophica bacterium]|nr:NAD(P)/FAD-dependent oxidoreductase [Candidatus Omnitrophota bacterium]
MFHINKLTNPKGLKKDQYDVIIIGAGIGGLVCGCYLAKAGLKVLIVEKNDKVGGYCTSFEREGYRFDSCIHYLGSYREDGQLRTVIRELGLEDKIEMKKMDPLDTIITSQYKVTFYRDMVRTVDSIGKYFISERENLQKFFSIITEGKFFEKVSYAKKFLTFDLLLKEIFKNIELQKIFSIPLLNLGLLPKNLFCLAGVILYREFILDGGYYPKGGIQLFIDKFADKIKQYHGEILLNTEINKIITKNQKSIGVITNKNLHFYSKYVVSSIDSRYTFSKLIGEENLPKKFIKKIRKKIPSSSMFMVYLGLDNQFIRKIFPQNYLLWYWPKLLWEKEIIDITETDFTASGFLATIFSMYEPSYVPFGKESLRLSTIASFKSKSYWRKYKYVAADAIIKSAEEIFPTLLKYIIAKIIITPQDLHSYTYNYKGAIYGWASLPSQAEPYVDFKTPIENLYLCSQWVSFYGIQGGVSMVSFVARHIARYILNKFS